MSISHESGVGKYSLVKEIKNWMMPPETATPYKYLTGITKSAEIAAVLIGLGAAGISAFTGVLTGAFIDLIGSATFSGAVMANKVVDNIAVGNNRSRRARQEMLQ